MKWRKSPVTVGLKWLSKAERKRIESFARDLPENERRKLRQALIFRPAKPEGPA